MMGDLMCMQFHPPASTWPFHSEFQNVSPITAHREAEAIVEFYPNSFVWASISKPSAVIPMLCWALIVIDRGGIGHVGCRVQDMHNDRVFCSPMQLLLAHARM